MQQLLLHVTIAQRVHKLVYTHLYLLAYLNAWHCEAERLDCGVCQPVCLGELNAGHIAMVLGQETESLMQRRAAMMRQRANVGFLVGYLVAIDGGISLASDKECRAILIIIWYKNRWRHIQAGHVQRCRQLLCIINAYLTLRHPVK